MIPFIQFEAIEPLVFIDKAKLPPFVANIRFSNESQEENNLSIELSFNNDTEKIEPSCELSREQVLFLRNYLDAFLEATKP